MLEEVKSKKLGLVLGIKLFYLATAHGWMSWLLESLTFVAAKMFKNFFFSLRKHS